MFLQLSDVLEANYSAKYNISHYFQIIEPFDMLKGLNEYSDKVNNLLLHENGLLYIENIWMLSQSPKHK